MSAFVNLVCPSCDAANRMPADGIDQCAGCIRCGAPIYSGCSIPLDDKARFQKHVVSSDVPVLVKFGAPWCGPCRVMDAEFEAAARRLEPQFRLIAVNTDAAPELGERHGVRAIPAVIMFSRGREVARFNGAVPAERIVRFAAEHLAEAEMELA